VSVGAIGLYYVIAVVSVRVIDGRVPANTGLSFAYSLVYLCAILAIAYLFSHIAQFGVLARPDVLHLPPHTADCRCPRRNR
jgi:hypothetical protein